MKFSELISEAWEGEKHGHNPFTLIINHMIPLTTKQIKDLGYSTEGITAYHATNMAGLGKLIKIQKTKKQISAYTRGDHKVMFRGVGVKDGGIIIKVYGDSVLHAIDDTFSTPDSNGRRWIPADEFFATKEDVDKVKRVSQRMDRIAQKFFGLGLTEDEVVEKARAEGKTKIIAKIIKKYIDEVTKIIKDNTYTLNVDKNTNKASFEYKHDDEHLSYNEIILNNFEIEDVYVANKAKAKKVKELFGLNAKIGTP